MKKGGGRDSGAKSPISETPGPDSVLAQDSNPAAANSAAPFPEVPFVFSSHTHIGKECELCVRDRSIALGAYQLVMKQVRALEAAYLDGEQKMIELAEKLTKAEARLDRHHEPFLLEPCERCGYEDEAREKEES